MKEEDHSHVTNPRLFMLVLVPRLSASDVYRETSWGHFYGGNQERRYALGDCESGNEFQRAAAQASLAWIEANAESIFDEISNVRYAGPLLAHYGEGRVEVESVARARDEIHFRVREVSPGSASIRFLRQLEVEVRSGADTWDGGDFGFVTSSTAKSLGMGDLWDRLFAFTDPDQVQMRVTLADPRARVLDSEGERLPEPAKQTCGNPYLTNRFRWKLF
jgi:catechol 2,3-dioxygenase-like lactoylglutathione lyase family enzyme